MPPLIDTAYQLPGSYRTGNIRDDMVQLKVHLHHSLLHVRTVSGGVFNQPFALRQIGSHVEISASGRKLPRNSPYDCNCQIIQIMNKSAKCPDWLTAVLWVHSRHMRG